MDFHITIGGERACEKTLSLRQYEDWRSRFKNFPQCWHTDREGAEAMASQYRQYFEDVAVLEGPCPRPKDEEALKCPRR